MRGPITITEKDFDKAVSYVAETIINSGDVKTDKVISAMFFSFAVFDQLYSDYSISSADSVFTKQYRKGDKHND